MKISRCLGVRAVEAAAFSLLTVFWFAGCGDGSSSYDALENLDSTSTDLVDGSDAEADAVEPRDTVFGDADDGNSITDTVNDIVPDSPDVSCGTCPGGKICVEGECQCPATQEDCSGTCTTLGTNENCSVCGDECPTGGSCESGACECPGAQVNCSGTCTTLGTDDNCSECGDTCVGVKTCQDKECAAEVDPDCVSSTLCVNDDDCESGSRCNLAMTLPACQKLYCGGYGTTCSEDYLCLSKLCRDDACTNDCSGLECGPDPVYGESCGGCQEGATCRSNICECDLQDHLECVAGNSTWIDSCGNVGEVKEGCPLACLNGACVDCEAVGKENCSGICKLLGTTSSCSGCGDVCPVGGRCESGNCKCPVGQTDCSGKCTLLGTDANCSECGDQCLAGGGCNNGVCTACCSGIECGFDPVCEEFCWSCGADDICVHARCSETTEDVLSIEKHCETDEQCQNENVGINWACAKCTTNWSCVQVGSIGSPTWGCFDNADCGSEKYCDACSKVCKSRLPACHGCDDDAQCAGDTTRCVDRIKYKGIESKLPEKVCAPSCSLSTGICNVSGAPAGAYVCAEIDDPTRGVCVPLVMSCDSSVERCETDDYCSQEGFVCYPGMGVCGCKDSLSCEPGEACHPFTHQCVASCAGDDECEDGSVCSQGLCTAPCSGSHETGDVVGCSGSLPLGYNWDCDSEGHCFVPGICLQSSDCPNPGTFCNVETHECTEGCLMDSDCKFLSQICDTTTTPGTCIIRPCRGNYSCNCGEVCNLDWNECQTAEGKYCAICDPTAEHPCGDTNTPCVPLKDAEGNNMGAYCMPRCSPDEDNLCPQGYECTEVKNQEGTSAGKACVRDCYKKVIGGCSTGDAPDPV